MNLKRIVVIGAGGFAREVEWLIRDLNRSHQKYEFLGFVVSDLQKLGAHDSKDRVLGDYGWLEKHPFDALAIGVGTPAARLKISSELSRRFPSAEWPSLVHPTAQLDQASAQIGEGTVVCAGVIGTVNIILGPYCMVNLSCTLGHETTVGRGSVLNPSVNLSGGVTVGSGVLVGTGAQILQYLSVGDGATVGAGAVVTKVVSPGETVAGIPAKQLVKRS